MSAAGESVAGDMEKSGVARVVERRYRNRTYRPARYYLTWYFVSSLWCVISSIILGAYAFLDGGVAGLEGKLWILLSTFFAGLFLVILSTFYGMLGSSLHLVLGDKGIYSLGSVPATMPVTHKSTFLCDTPQQKALYPAKYHGARITRYFLIKWGRKGGCMNWPGKAGGKAEGFWAAVRYSWEEAELPTKDGKSVIVEPIEWQPCPSCNRDRSRKLEPDKDEKNPVGFVRVVAPTASQLRAFAEEFPGIKRGGVIDIRNQVSANRYLDELPWPLLEAIRSDEEYRASSRVDMCWDPLPDDSGLGMVMSHNAEIELFGLQFTSKIMRAQNVGLNQTIAQLSSLRGPLGGNQP